MNKKYLPMQPMPSHNGIKIKVNSRQLNELLDYIRNYNYFDVKPFDISDNVGRLLNSAQHRIMLYIAKRMYKKLEPRTFGLKPDQYLVLNLTHEDCGCITWMIQYDTREEYLIFFSQWSNIYKFML